MSKNAAPGWYFQRHYLTLSCLFLILGLCRLTAEEALQTLRPKTPLLPRMSNLSEWTITYRYSREKARERFMNPEKKEPEETADEQDSPDDEPVTIFPKSRTITKQGQVYREVTRWSNGEVTEKWIVNGLQLMEIPGSNELLRVGLSGYPPDMSDYSRSDFEDFEWIGLDNYKGVRSVRGGQAYEFSTAAVERRLTPREKWERHSEEGYKKLPESEEAFPFVAYLDAKTQRPLLLDNGRVVQIYRYADKVPALPTMPQKFAEEFQQWRDEIAQKNTPLPPP